jgi:nucleotide-binding universal stress UspA family protein
VAPSVCFGGGDGLYAIGPGDEKVLEDSLAEIKPNDRHVDFEHRMLVGDPAKEIVRLAREEDADLIVIGTHGRTGIARALLGSVAEVVVRRAPCPVLAYKHPLHVAATTN